MLCDGPNPEPQPSAHQCQSWKGSLLFTDRNCSCIQVCNLVKGNGTQWSLVPGYHQLWFVIRKNESLWNRRCHLRVDRGWWVLSRKRWEPVKLGPVPTPVCFEATRKRLSLFLGIFVRLWQFHPWLCVCVILFFLKLKAGEVVSNCLSTKINITVEIRWETASKIRAKTLQDLPEDTLCDTMQLPRDTPVWEHDQANRMISSSKPLWASPVIALCIQFASEIIQKTKRSDQESKRKRVSMLQITDLEDDLCLKHRQKIKNMLMILAPGRRGHLRGQLRRQAPFYIRLVPGGCILVICCDRTFWTRRSKCLLQDPEVNLKIRIPWSR